MPRVLLSGSQADLRRFDTRALVGESSRLVTTGEYAHPGIVQQIHLTLTTATGSTRIDVDRNVQGVTVHELGANGSGAYDREIYAAVLQPGLYHMKITIPQGRREFEGFESAISVGIQPFTRMPSNQELAITSENIAFCLAHMLIVRN